MFRQLGLHRKHQPVDLFISQANSSQMKIEGMTWLTFKLARTTGELKVCVAPDLCEDLILGSDWLRLDKAQICFDLATLVLEEVEVPLENEVEKNCSGVAQIEVKLPPRIAVSSEERIDTVEKLMKELYQITPTERYDNSEE